MKKQITKGYKVTNSDLSCNGFTFEVGKKHVQSGALKICSNGFHFCDQLNDCFNYYSFNSENRVFEIEAYGDLDKIDNKSCCLEIKLKKELSWLEVLNLVNIGKDNTGRLNTGDRNTGDRNTGDWNTGDSNTGYSNTGYRNTGDRNTGDRNTGDSNTGDRNTGNWNTGNWNTGDSNTGYSNTGYRNTGDRNTGDRNTGNWNTGDSNTGYSNTGNWNTGNRNTGDSNTGYRNTGAFCTDNNPMVRLFDMDTNMSVREWESHKAFNIMANYLEINIWVPEYKMTDNEKSAYQSYKTAEGFLKPIAIHEAWANMWNNLSDEYKQVFLNLPNFDKDKFKLITGLSV